MQAISTMACCSTSRPVISRSIQTRRLSSPRSVTGGTLSRPVPGTGRVRTGRFPPAMAAPPVVWRPDADAAARQQRRALHGGRGDRRFRRRWSSARSTSPSGSGPRSCASSASRSRRRSRACSTPTDGIPWAKWFTGATCNIARMCVDELPGRPARRHLGRRGRRDPHADRRRTADADRPHRGRAGRARRRRGDAVGLFMPMVPETVAAMFAIAKLGAVFLPIFSGYGADAVAVRLADADAVALVTADGFTGRGKVVAMKETADAAVAQVPTRAHRGRRAPVGAPTRRCSTRSPRAARVRTDARAVPSTASIRCSSRTRAARRAGPRARCTCTAASR